MSAEFPLSAKRHGGEHDQPPTTPTWAIFNARGYWANIAGYFYQRPASDPASRGDVETIVRMLNAVYEQGKADAKAEIRDALGIES